MPVSEVLSEYLNTRLHLATNTQMNNKSVLFSFVRELGPIQIGNLTPQHVERYFLGPKGIHHRMNASSYNKVRQRVDGFLKFCERRGDNRRPLLENVRPR